MLTVENYESKGEKAVVSGETISKIRSWMADLHSDDGPVRREARRTLAFVGKPAVDLLLPLLKDPDDDVRWETAKALAEIADPKAAYDLVGLLVDHNFGVRWVAAEALMAIGRDSLEPLLERLTEQPESAWLRRGAHHVLRVLARKAPDLRELVGPVITALEGFEPEIGCLEPAYAALEGLRGPAGNLLAG
jgi:hypothetical protein